MGKEKKEKHKKDKDKKRKRDHDGDEERNREKAVKMVKLSVCFSYQAWQTHLPLPSLTLLAHTTYLHHKLMPMLASKILVLLAVHSIVSREMCRRHVFEPSETLSGCRQRR